MVASFTGLNIAVAGTGSIGKRHISEIEKLTSRVNWTFVRENKTHDQFSLEKQASLVSSVRQALITKPHFLIISNPSFLHAEIIQQALQASIPFYVEKPVAINHEQISALSNAIKVFHPLPCTQVGCNLRFLPSIRRFKEVIDEGLIGHIARASFEVGQWLPDWRPATNYIDSYSANPDQGGGVLLDLIHEIDIARWIFGTMKPISCIKSYVPSLEILSESVASATLTTPNNAIVNINLDYIARKPVRRYQVVGDKGTIVWDLSLKELTLQTVTNRYVLSCGPNDFDILGTYRTAWTTFLDSLCNDLVCVQPLTEGLETSALAIQLKEMACQI
ncbi:Gfo/Idh/MocA family protein [Synechococcus sp. LTW-R]|uniref:Gfo/Idh/MocA family protein n=1 Tax=Synechococcus sp. LTW-R TaxID=2751170 RepID=UPI00162975C3|nr:Gfo/Idh/MocA family oxidoreductase [Synechococcus sp. LTW-R]QNG29039.1 Gfo/Idh/MocA family oxidoreductase [Synechococcus sp. LTW-R]